MDTLPGGAVESGPGPMDTPMSIVARGSGPPRPSTREVCVLIPRRNQGRNTWLPSSLSYAGLVVPLGLILPPPIHVVVRLAAIHDQRDLLRSVSRERRRHPLWTQEA